MARPPCCRKIAAMPTASAFGPIAASTRELDQVVISLDEFEAVRLADLEELYQEHATEKMGVSRPTFSRIIESAHRKIAEALISGKGLRIEGGYVRMERRSPSRCPRCGREWAGTCECPRCRGTGDAQGPHKTVVVVGRPRHGRRGCQATKTITQVGCVAHSAKERTQ